MRFFAQPRTFFVQSHEIGGGAETKTEISLIVQFDGRRVDLFYSESDFGKNFAILAQNFFFYCLRLRRCLSVAIQKPKVIPGSFRARPDQC